MWIWFFPFKCSHPHSLSYCHRFFSSQNSYLKNKTPCFDFRGFRHSRTCVPAIFSSQPKCEQQKSLWIRYRFNSKLLLRQVAEEDSRDCHYVNGMCICHGAFRHGHWQTRYGWSEWYCIFRRISFSIAWPNVGFISRIRSKIFDSANVKLCRWNAIILDKMRGKRSELVKVSSDPCAGGVICLALFSFSKHQSTYVQDYLVKVMFLLA